MKRTETGGVNMHTVDLLPVLFVGGIFLFFAYKIAADFLSARRTL